MSDVDVSVVIPARDAEPTLPALLAALMPQVEARPGAEVVLVDSGSTDRTAELAGAAGARVVRAAADGASAARNEGVRAARGELVAFLDSDCIPRAGWLDRLTGALVDAPQIGASGGRIISAPPTNLLQRHAERVGYINQEDGLEDPFLPYLLTANCCYRRTVLEQLGGLDEELRSSEDTDLSWRMQLETGLTVTFVADAVVEHVHRTTLRGMWQQWVRYGWGSVQLVDRYPGRPRLPASRTRNSLAGRASTLTRAARALAGLPFGRSDPLDAAAPLLRAIELGGWNVGQRRARRAGRSAIRR